MAKVRQDAWSHEDDMRLAETVLRHIREGNTQLTAFEEVGNKLNRTPAACGFRWNGGVRIRYIQAIEVARKQLKQRKRAQAMSHLPIGNDKVIESFPEGEKNKGITESEAIEQEISLGKIIKYLQSLTQKPYESNQIDKLQSENDALLQKITELEKEITVKVKHLETVEEDYRSFIQIMERARKMTVLEETDKADTPG